MKHRTEITDKELIELLKEAKPAFIVPHGVDAKTREMIRVNTVRAKAPAVLNGKARFLKFSAAIAASVIVCLSLYLVVSYIHDRDISTGVYTVESSGDFSIIRHGETVLKHVKAGVVSGDIIKTGTTGHCRLRLNRAEVVLAANSLISIDTLDNSDKTVFSAFIRKGTIAVRSMKLDKDSSISIRTKDAVVSVKGTRFLVSAAVTGTRVSVSEGKVLLEGKKDETFVVEKNNTAHVLPDSAIRVTSDPGAVERVNSVLGLGRDSDTDDIIGDTPSDVTENPVVSEDFEYLGSLTVKGNDIWKRSGISVNYDSTIRVIASGKVKIDPTSQFDIPPDGIALSENWLTKIYRNAPFGTLLLRVDNKIFPGGSDKTIDIDRSGEITFMVNDSVECSSDNRGSFDVKIYAKRNAKK